MPNFANVEGLSKTQFVQKLHDKAKFHMEGKGEQYARSANKGRKKVLFKEGEVKFHFIVHTWRNIEELQWTLSNEEFKMVIYEFTWYALVWWNQFCREIREERRRHADT
ncbi:hypothetical protein CR513_27784, partial [Mucuna pruriens]